MRKFDREIKDFNKIVELLNRCDTIRIAMIDGVMPYIVPMSFGMEEDNGKIVIYLHGAKAGKKHDIIENNNNVCVEADILHGYSGTGHGVTADYESIIGNGTMEIVKNKAEAIKGLDLLLAHCGIVGYNTLACVELGITEVFKITLQSVSGKKRFN